MSNQQGPVNRPPWFRLATMMRPPPPPPTTPAAPPPQPSEPLPPPRPAFIRPTFRAQPPPPPPPQQPTSPPPPPSPHVASQPPPLPLVFTPPPPSPPMVASPTTVVASPPPAPPSPQIAGLTPPPTVMLPGPTMPSPRTIGTTPPPPSAAPASSPSSSAQQLPATNGSTIPSSPITKQPFPSFPSPKPKLSFPSPPPPPPSPSPSPSEAGLTTTTTHPTTPTSSPKTVKTLGKTPLPSPNLKPLSHPPSPLTLPPPQLNSDTEQETRSPPVYEQKTVLVQETNQKLKASPKNFNMFKPTINTNIPKHDSPKQNMNHKKKHSDSEDSGTVIITISGENKGAIMELTPSRKPTELGHVNAHKSGSNNSHDTAKNKDQKAIPHPMTAFTNSNVQCVNNSILYNCSMTHHDPGVHFSISKKPSVHNGIHHKD